MCCSLNSEYDSQPIGVDMKYIHIMSNKYLDEIYVSLQSPKKVLELWKSHHKWREGDTYKDHLSYQSFSTKKILKDLNLKKLNELAIENSYDYFLKNENIVGKDGVIMTPLKCNKWFLINGFKDQVENPQPNEIKHNKDVGNPKHWEEYTIENTQWDSVNRISY